MEIHFNGKRVVVTAGGAGIGRKIAESFLHNGAKVHVCDVARNSLDDLKSRHPGVGATLADVSDPAQVDLLFDDARRAMGGVDVLINNAGIAGPTADAENVSPEEWMKVIAVNVNGQFFCARRAIPLIKQAGGGSLVNISSAAIWKGGFPQRSPYATSKVAVIGLTQTLAMELGPSHIRVNAVLPGVVMGDRLQRVLEAKEQTTGVPHAEIYGKVVSQVSMRSAVSEEEVANLVLFLCSDLAAHISGQTISVCGNFEGHHGAG